MIGSGLWQLAASRSRNASSRSSGSTGLSDGWRRMVTVARHGRLRGARASLTIIGWFLVNAALDDAPNEAGGLDQALHSSPPTNPGGLVVVADRPVRIVDAAFPHRRDLALLRAASQHREPRKPRVEVGAEAEADQGEEDRYHPHRGAVAGERRRPTPRRGPRSPITAARNRDRSRNTGTDQQHRRRSGRAQGAAPIPLATWSAPVACSSSATATAEPTRSSAGTPARSTAPTLRTIEPARTPAAWRGASSAGARPGVAGARRQWRRRRWPAPGSSDDRRSAKPSTGAAAPIAAVAMRAGAATFHRPCRARRNGQQRRRRGDPRRSGARAPCSRRA